MRRLLPLFSLFLAVLWLPATQHCGLEEVGVLAKTCAEHGLNDGAGEKDGCATVENGAYKPAAHPLTVAAPALQACACFLSLHVVRPEAVAERSILPGVSFQRPQDWVSTWYFVRRAAPSPRAPSLLCA